MIKTYENTRPSTKSAFSLLEMAITVGVIGLVAGFTLQMTTASNAADAQECYVTTSQQLRDVHGAIENFAHKNDRLPMPAARNVGVESPSFGRESSGTNIDQFGTGPTAVSYGALPFQALGLASSYAGDCWGNKLTYIVTTALTTPANPGGYLDTNIGGNITLKASPTVTTNDKIAYAIISHGKDGLGAATLNYADASHGWCTGVVSMKSMNCMGNTMIEAAIGNATYNDGKDAGVNYFDDLIVTAGRTATAAPPTCPLPWGGTIAVGDQVMAFETPSATTCNSEIRECTASGLTGSFVNPTCIGGCDAGGGMMMWQDTNYHNCPGGGAHGGMIGGGIHGGGEGSFDGAPMPVPGDGGTMCTMEEQIETRGCTAGSPGVMGNDTTILINNVTPHLTGSQTVTCHNGVVTFSNSICRDGLEIE